MKKNYNAEDVPKSYQTLEKNIGNCYNILMRRFFFVVVLGIFIGLIVKLFVFDVLTVSGDSMMPNFHNKDVVFVYKLSYGLVKPFSSEFFLQWKTPKNGDVVIFLHENKFVVKRCVGIAGDILDFSQNDDYNLILNEKIIPLTFGQFETLKQFEKVPENCVFVLGDNYKTSVDSRNYGFVRAENIIGKVISGK